MIFMEKRVVGRSAPATATHDAGKGDVSVQRDSAIRPPRAAAAIAFVVRQVALPFCHPLNGKLRGNDGDRTWARARLRARGSHVATYQKDQRGAAKSGSTSS
jgi:hypothetical protein